MSVVEERTYSSIGDTMLETLTLALKTAMVHSRAARDAFDDYLDICNDCCRGIEVTPDKALEVFALSMLLRPINEIILDRTALDRHRISEAQRRILDILAQERPESAVRATESGLV